MMRRIGFWMLMLGLSLALASCAKDDEEVAKQDMKLDFSSGYFVLNEGIFGSTPGRLDYLSMGLDYQKSLLKEVNGNEDLGNTPQSIDIAGGKIYIVSQDFSQEDDKASRLLIANASTLEVERVLRLKDIQKGTHIRALEADGKVYLVVQYGAWDAPKLSILDLSADGAPIKIMPGETESITGAGTFKSLVRRQIGGKSCVVAMQTENEANQVCILTVKDGQGQLQSNVGETSTLIAGKEQNTIFFLKQDAQTGKGQIRRVDLDNPNSVVEFQTLETKLGGDYASVPFAAIGMTDDTIYYYGETERKIFRYIRSKGSSEEFADLSKVENTETCYNGLAVCQKSGRVFFYGIKDWQHPKENVVLVYSGKSGEIVKKIEGEVDGLAGIFPVANFR